MRTIKLKHEEIELIKNALQYVYDTKLDNVSKQHKLLTEDERKVAIMSANKYFDLQENINNGNLDV